MNHDPKVLVALIGETRAWELTWDKFCTNALDSLDADLALCGREEPPNPLHERAKYVWSYAEPGDWAEVYDRAVGSPAWRVLLEVPGGHFFGGVEDQEHPQSGSAAIQFFYRALLGRSLEQAGAWEKYDWFVHSRSDFMWPLPHPPVRYLSERHIYFLDGEQYGGVTDRHAIVPRRYAKQFLSFVDPVFEDPEGLRRRIDRVMAEQERGLFNIEQFLALRLKELGLWRRVRYLPYVPYAVRAPGGPTRWSVGTYDEELGYFIKYPPEKERSEIAADFITDQESWRRYLAPVRGALRRRRLRKAYRERGLYERAFLRREPLLRAVRRARLSVQHSRLSVKHARHSVQRLRWQINRPVRQMMAMLDRAGGRLGPRLRRMPAMPLLLDARVRRMRRRAERRGR